MPIKNIEESYQQKFIDMIKNNVKTNSIDNIDNIDVKQLKLNNEHCYIFIPHYLQKKINKLKIKIIYSIKKINSKEFLKIDMILPSYISFGIDTFWILVDNKKSYFFENIDEIKNEFHFYWSDYNSSDIKKSIALKVKNNDKKSVVYLDKIIT